MPFEFPIPDLLGSPTTRAPTSQTHPRRPDLFKAKLGPVPEDLVPLKHPPLDLTSLAYDLLTLVARARGELGTRG